ncbi:MAG: DNA polymerase III subunit gamma/tau [Deltaproteobacteria bacterium]|nr:DNA polymerase III subunit gamma/tau [Deltaproteobacteria bacterium]
MSYQVIARKWRPNLFTEVIGQEHVVRTLTNAVSSGRIGHAYLFSGARGVGKTTVARILAKCLNCEKGPTTSPCNSCETCRTIASSSSMDVIEIDGASNTGVENVRELRESVAYAPSLGRYKVYIVDEAHMLSTPAFNALLKTLEEPPSHVVFIFATTEPHKIPITIHSRCQRFDFRRIPLKKINSHLLEIAGKEGITIEEEALYLITRESEGSLRDAQSLLEQVISFSGSAVKTSDVIDCLGLMDRSLIYELLENVLKKDAKGCLNIVEKAHDFGYDFKRVIIELLGCVRDVVVVRVGGEEALTVPESEVTRLKALCEGISLERLQMLFAVLTKGYEDVTRSSVARFSFELALLKAVALDDLVPVGEIIARLEGFRGSSAAVGGAEKKEEKKIEKGPALSPGVESSLPGFLKYVKEKNGLISKPLEGATLSLDGDSLTILADVLSANFLQMKKDALDALLRDYFKKGVAVDIKKAEEKRDTLPCAQESRGGDPVLKETLATLGGRVIEERRKDGV